MRVTLVLLASLVACDGGENPSTDALATDGSVIDGDPLTITGIAVSPASPLVEALGTTDLVVTATHAGGSTSDVTADAVWSTDNSSVAVVTAGRVSGLVGGSAIITANVATFTASATVTVLDPTIAVAANSGVDFFPSSSSGQITPTRSIRGSQTFFLQPDVLAVSDTEIFVGDANVIAVFPRNGNGNVAPTRRIAGASTHIVGGVMGLAVVGTNLYVLVDGAILVWPVTANGNVAPAREITDIGLASPGGMAIADNEIFVASNHLPRRVSVYSLGASGVTPPVRTITGPQTRMTALSSIVVTQSEIIVGNVEVSTPTPPSIAAYPRSASGDIAPTRFGTLQGISPNGLAVVGNSLWVANGAYNGGVLVYPVNFPNSPVMLRAISGTATIRSPYGIAVL